MPFMFPGRTRAVLALIVVAALAAVPSMASAGSADQVAARVLVGLQRDTAGLEALATRVSDPAGPVYGRYPSVAALARRYGATNATVAAARRQLAKAGLPAGTLDATRGFLIVPATQSQLNGLDRRASQAERGGPGAAMAAIRAGAGGLVTELVTEPVVPKAQGVAATPAAGRPSLYGFSWPSRTGTARGCAQGVSTPMPEGAIFAAAFPNSKAFTPNQFQTAFGMTPLHRAGLQGQGQHIALFEVGAGVSPADMATFARCFGLPQPNMRVVPVGQSQPVSPLVGEGTIEAQLDVQAVMTAAPRARISVVEGNQMTSMPEIMSAALDARRMRGVPDVLSISYGVCEVLVQNGSEAPFLGGSGARRLSDWVLATAAAAGVSVVVSTGDSGSQGCAHNIGSTPAGPSAPGVIALASTPYVGYPASSPWAVAVGGTDMTLTKGNALRSQTVWNDRVAIGIPPMSESIIGGVPTIVFGAGGGTGGNSQLYGTPRFQSSVGITSNRRLVPDVSMFAARGVVMVCGVFDPATGQGPCPPTSASWPFMSVAGTSFAAPLLAGAVALANQAARAEGTPRAGFLNPLLYSSARSAVVDVTQGNNDVFGTGRCCFAGRGYDQATGLGTVNAARLARALVRAGR